MELLFFKKRYVDTHPMSIVGELFPDAAALVILSYVLEVSCLPVLYLRNIHLFYESLGYGLVGHPGLSTLAQTN